MLLMNNRVVFCIFVLCLIKCVSAKSRKPNIVIFLTDDQDIMLGSMDVMDYTRERLIRHGATFNNAFTTSPICCPSRSSFLTGLYSHNHNVLTNNENCSSIAWQVKHESRSFATYLNKTGYSTAYFGKYLNEYNGSYIPQGWQYWMGLVRNSRYYNYSLRHNDVKESHRDNYQDDYFTDLIVNRSMTYFRRKKHEEPDSPILSVLSFPAPHGSEDGAPQYQHLYANVTSHITPSFDYGPNPDKHWIISSMKGPMDETQHRFSSILQQKRLQTLRSVDDAVDRFVSMLEDTGELDNTYLLYTSDHGFHIGQFGLAKGKSMPYDFDIRVPLYMRGPGIQEGLHVNEIILNIDMAPTILGIAGVEVPEWMDGRNFMPVIRRQPVTPPWRDSFLIERGKIPLNRVHLAKPVLPSKQERIEEECRSPVYKYPCDPGQEWTCVLEDGESKIRKCKRFKAPRTRSQKRRRKCTCHGKKKTTVSHDCMRRLNQIKREYKRFATTNERRRFIRRASALRRSNQWHSFLSGDEGGLGSSRYSDESFSSLDGRDGLFRTKRRSPNNEVVSLTNNRTVVFNKLNMAISPQCVFMFPEYKIKCNKGASRTGARRWKKKRLEQLNRHIVATRLRLKLLRIASACVTNKASPQRIRRSPQCKCRTSSGRAPKPRIEPRVQQQNQSVNPMKIIAMEIRQAYNKRLQVFRERRQEVNFHRIKKKIKQSRPSRGRCNSNGMSCFKLDGNRWETPPVWEGENRCYCTSSNNNTYWCIRIINATSNLLYCEFITGFVEYYDLRTDPHQRSNTYLELNTNKHNALNAELAQLRVCKGAANCHVSRNISNTTTTSAATQTTTETTTTLLPSVTPDIELDIPEPGLELSSTTTTTTQEPATNYPPGVNPLDVQRPQKSEVRNRKRYPDGQRRAQGGGRRPGCNTWTRRRDQAAWRKFCRTRSQAGRRRRQRSSNQRWRKYLHG
ncbi:extracellular sulfatase Sulf-1 [Ciona intestinalis]